MAERSLIFSGRDDFVNPSRQPTGLKLRAGTILVAGWLLGCGAAIDPNLVPVHGRITLDGKPLPRGSITLRPESTKDTWEQPTGSIEADGKYVVYTQGKPGAPPGRYRVVVFATEAARDADGKAHPGLPTSIVPAIYNDPETTPLIIEVTLPSRAPFDLELPRHDEK